MMLCGVDFWQKVIWSCQNFLLNHIATWHDVFYILHMKIAWKVYNIKPLFEEDIQNLFAKNSPFSSCINYH